MVDSTYAFLDFELGPRSLTRCGKSVAVRPKTLATLVYLVTHRDRVVSKDELLEAVWPDVYVHDQAVFQSISELRSVFAPLDCIETVRGRGYRWKLALDDEHPPARPSRPLRRLLVAAAAVAAVAVVGVWNTASEPTAATVVVNPDIGTSLSDRIEDAAPGMTQMLVHHLRQMGWDARGGSEGTAPDGAARVTIDIAATEPSLTIRYTLSQDLGETRGVVEAASPLGAVRDLATVLHQSLAAPREESAGAIRVADLLAEAKQHIDAGDYDLAKAYLTVVIAEQPDHPDARLALAYTHQQCGEYREALELSRNVHLAALDAGRQAERMMSAIIVSQVTGALGDFEASERYARDALEVGSELNDLLIVAEAQEQLGELSLAHGDVDVGLRRLGVALQYYTAFCPTGEARVSKRLHDLEHTALIDDVTAEPATGEKEIG